MAQNDHAVVVAITRYPDLSDLRGPENDARAFERWLTDPAGGAVPPSQVYSVTTSEFPEPWPGAPQPTTGDINDAFDPLVRPAFQERRKLGRRLYIFMAGHGFAADASEAALFAADASEWKLGSYVQGRLYAEWFRSAGLFEEVVLIMDCCRNQYAAAPVALPPWRELTLGKAARRVYAYASAYGQLARERDHGGEYRGLFTRALLDGLSPAGSRDALGRITGETLKRYVHAELPKLSRAAELKEEQIPDFVVDDGIVFAEAGPGWGVLLRMELAPARAGHRMVLLHDREEVARHEAAAGAAWECRVQPGIYKLLDETAGDSTLFEPTGQEHHVRF